MFHIVEHMSSQQDAERILSAECKVQSVECKASKWVSGLHFALCALRFALYAFCSGCVFQHPAGGRSRVLVQRLGDGDGNVVGDRPAQAEDAPGAAPDQRDPSDPIVRLEIVNHRRPQPRALEVRAAVPGSIDQGR